ncbi:hypothetical protein B9T33_14690 [Acinetobacter sp. ANC 5054]|uniref:hypothetical protein n=1 Tax=Acinetobacter sp. ANC 5054 TaxID=1977877 RepID=UPI000A32D132|nr:hypothetical protein [Acinetobacter sp. ANC 5054]OTG78032.1 hypothetical protein B9T33_14690 [Acinetobacter sp. ANC 5054]
MEVTLDQVRSVFEDVLQKRMTREEASVWAFSVIVASDNDSLTLVPNEKKDKLWKGILYLGGIDLIGIPYGYLFYEEDIIIEMPELSINKMRLYETKLKGKL